MTNTYSNYLTQQDTLSFDQATALFTDLLEQADTKHADFQFLWEDIVRACAHYTQVRSEWHVTDLETKGRIGRNRTSAHNVVINNLVALERFMSNQGWHTDWATELGLSQADTRRKRIGDFANYITYVTALNGR